MRFIPLAVTVIIGLGSTIVLGSDALAAEHKYVGAGDCGKCHKKELMGDQLAAWKKGPHAKAFETLGLSARASSKDIKTRYKELVKLHHPDANGADRGSEERFRNVIQAYRLLKQGGFC